MGQINLLEYPVSNKIYAFTTTKEGGVSCGAYTSFNITHYCGDDPEHVAKNREMLCKQLGIVESALILPHQTHSLNVYSIKNDFFDLSEERRMEHLYNVDALITQCGNICIGVSTADCVPVLLYDEPNGIIAAIHAGWRGVVGNIVGKTIKKMMTEYHSSPTHVKVIIGPSISLNAFEVGDEVYEAFKKANFDMASIAVRASKLGLPTSVEGEDKWHIDLWASITTQLLNSSVPLENIHIAGVCTYTEHDTYFSARRAGINSGRLFTGIMIKEDK